MSLRIAFRADASVEIGSGHVMRCLTLAAALRAGGAECRFVSRDLPGNLNTRIAAEGFAVTSLPAPAPGTAPEPAPPPLAHWARVPHAQDAAQTLDALATGADWLVVDHYALDARWERAACPPGTRLMVLDDLADRAHDGDLLLDQTLGRRAAEYDTLVPARTRRLIGPRFALLRPEFARRRAASLTRRADGRLAHLLVLMGGMDAENTVSDILAGLRDTGLPPDTRVSVVIGSRAPHLASVRALAGRMPFAVDIHVDVTDMAALMQETDFAISASGLISYELICMGVPALLVPVSPIQHKVAHETCRIAEARVVEGWREAPARRIGEAARDYLAYLAALPVGQRRRGDAVDGLGTERVVEAMLREP
ncbi:MAG: Spore coat polysaccharide biosynthesis protein, predicted glycosyltransferase [Rhodobacteraceae bacterium HLUCCA12]|nr:MAG: Spore coat polysaccharide biosynthesis protein, predicted glycosyltransferase [Rhodobacteraceae bacterium HLUCCA12]